MSACGSSTLSFLFSNLAQRWLDIVAYALAARISGVCGSNALHTAGLRLRLFEQSPIHIYIEPQFTAALEETRPTWSLRQAIPCGVFRLTLPRSLSLLYVEMPALRVRSLRGDEEHTKDLLLQQLKGLRDSRCRISRHGPASSPASILPWSAAVCGNYAP